MGGEGSMSSANTILKNNRSLLRKKRMFDKENLVAVNSTKKSFEKETYIAKKLSAKELRTLRRKRLQEAAKEKKHQLILISVMAVAFSFLGMQLFQIVKEKKQFVNGKQELYKHQLNLGDAYAAKNEWSSAAVHYKAATEVFPEEYDAYSRLLYGYVFNCTYHEQDCNAVIMLLEDMYQKFPDKKEVFRSVYHSLPRDYK